MRRAFTLIELLVVIAIIAILAVIASVEYNKYRSNAMYSVLESNLKAGIAWAESIVADYEKFPNGICDASSLSGSGSIKCEYSVDNDTITQSANGGISVDIPLKITWRRDKNDPTCGIVKVECPKERCSGLANSSGNGNAVICENTCLNPEKISADVNLYGIVNGGCP